MGRGVEKRRSKAVECLSSSGQRAELFELPLLSLSLSCFDMAEEDINGGVEGVVLGWV